MLISSSPTALCTTETKGSKDTQTSWQKKPVHMCRGGVEESTESNSREALRWTDI